MDCAKLQDDLPLLLFGELSAAEQDAVREHLTNCPDCHAEFEKFEKLQTVLADRSPVEVNASLLAESRMALDAAIENERHGWRALWSSAFRTLRIQPSTGLAAALTLIICGFWVGWGIRPHTNRLSPNVGGEVNTAGTAGPNLENMNLSRISRVDRDPETGGVKIVMDAEPRVTLEGSTDDPQIQRVLADTVKNYDNPGVRRDTLDALRNHADNPAVRQALIYAMQHDPNAGVRLEALGAVTEMKSESDVHAALLNALEHDTNPGMRVAAVNAIVDNPSRQDWDAPTASRLAHLASTDSNAYVRMRCANAVYRSDR